MKLNNSPNIYMSNNFFHHPSMVYEGYDKRTSVGVTIVRAVQKVMKMCTSIVHILVFILSHFEGVSKR